MSEKPEKTNFWLRFACKHLIIANLVYILLAGGVLVGLGFFFLNRWTHHGAVAEIPNVCNFSYNRAMNVLEDEGFVPEISDSVYDARLTPGTVIGTWPKAGAIVKPGREVYLTIASFQPRKVSVSMPLVNVSSRQALKYLESLGVKNVRIVNVPSQFPDLVLGARYQNKEIVPGTLLPVNAQVTLEVGIVPTVAEEDINNESDENIPTPAHEFKNSTTTYEDSGDEPTSVAFD